MPVFGTQNFGSGAKAAYEIDYSCVLDAASSAYLDRTPGSAGDRKTWTMSFWFKLTKLGSSTSGGERLFTAGSTEFTISDSNDQLYLIDGTVYRQTNGVFRDTSAWYHIFIGCDTTQSTAGDRFKFYLNGELPSLATDNQPAEDFEFDINNTNVHYIGREGSNYLDAYISEFHLVDGTQRVVGDFGETNDQGVWVPKQYTGSHGTQGVYLDFADSGNLGDDESGNGLDWAENNIVAADQVTDSPTLNYPIINYNDAHRESNAVLSEGNLKWTNSNTGKANDARATFGISSGKYYWECELDTLGQSGVNREFIGIVSPEWDLTAGSGGASFSGDSTGYAIATKGDKITGGSVSSYGSAMSAGDIVGVALDLDNGKIWFSINGTYPASGDPAAGSNEAYSSISGIFSPAFCVDYGTGSSTLIANFGQRSFNTAAPTGFSALNSATLPIPAIKDPSTNFQAVLYTGNGTAIGSGGKAVTFGGNSDMQPDAVWIKNRSQADDGQLYDAPRGVTKQVEPSARTDETTESEGLTTFGSDGFTVGSRNEVNTNTENYVAWCWNASNSGSSNTAGSINTTTTYVDQSAGISISTYTGNGIDGATVGHGLGVTPKTVLIFQRSNNDHHPISNWRTGVTAFTEKMNLDLDTSADGSSTQVKGGSSTTFTMGSDPGINGDGRTYVAYCWAEVHGFSRLGTYTGNGQADGTFAWCGFKPAWVMVKPESRDDGWVVWDTKRNTYNLTNLYLQAGSSNQEYTGTVRIIDILSNGFKLKASHNSVNGDGDFYIYMAFAENPFGGEDVSPATAR